jgi:translation initiation factor IF-1
MYRVRLLSGREIRAGLSSSARNVIVRIIAGDAVELRLSATDPNRGQITKKR